MIKNDWTFDEIASIYYTPLLDLIYQAATVHRQNDNYSEVQVSSLISIKTGGCPEDCAYCSQSVHHNAGIKVEPLMPLEKVIEAAQAAKKMGASRLCMGAAWREVRNNKDFDKVLDMATAVNEMGMEVCCTLGMLSDEQAVRLKQAGVYAYNHNLDTSEKDYGRIISTRVYQDRLRTLESVRKAGITVCSGGIIGLGETDVDRISMLHTLATLPVHPESVPINVLIPVKGTPLEDQQPVPVWELVRMIATARILMPASVVRLSAGRTFLSAADQALCFMAGANSIFIGEKLLTAANPAVDQDLALFKTLGLKSREAFKVPA